ncbi:DUF2510 domain-containing protein [Gordonia tangerina]|uniref:DUF2510 domain-containing protein n=1 Tax=Gordonia tangerina TaxID=2911060 RepID=UPI0035580121
MHTAPGWYADPWQQAQFRWFDGTDFTATLSSAPGWYRDPWQQAAWRWFDGSQWTASASRRTAPSGQPHASGSVDSDAGARSADRSRPHVAHR